MFERFTEKAIKVIMLAQEEARRLRHNFVGTEQVLLGLIGEGTGVAAKTLKSMGVTLKDARAEVEKIIGRGSGFVAVEIPFTPRAKRVLELSWDEARQLGHNYIGTEHLLLGLIREGEGVAARVLENLGVDLNKMHYDQAARALIRNELNIPLNAPVFGHVGRLTEIKNHRFLLDVFSEILKRQPESILLLCGRGELEKQLKFQAQELGIDQSVQFLGVRDDIPKVLSAVDVFLFPSLSEGLGLAVVEAQSSGLPCIVSTGVPDSVKIREQTEFLDLSLGANKWASEAIKALSECDASTRDKAFINAQVAGFDIKDSANWLCKLYLSHYRPS